MDVEVQVLQQGEMWFTVTSVTIAVATGSVTVPDTTNN